MLMLSITTVTLAEELTVKEMAKSPDFQDKELKAIEREVITGEVKTILPNGVETWKFSDIEPHDENKIYVVLTFEEFEDGTPVAVTLKDAKTNVSGGTWNGTIDDSRPKRFIWFFATSENDYILEIKHDDGLYLPLRVLPQVLSNKVVVQE